VNAAAISIQDLGHSYSDGRISLSGLDLDIPEGTRLGIVGANGAGKTTLLLCLAGVLKATGKILIGQREVDPSGPGQSDIMVGLVFQDPRDQLFCTTVFEDVAFGPRNLGFSEEDVQRLAKESIGMVGLSGALDRPSHNLSYGEQKRAALASVLAMRLPVLALDEPSAFLDPRSRRELISLIGTLEGTIVIASHDLDFVLETCSRTVILEEGRLVADGLTSRLLADEVLLERHRLELPLSLRGSEPPTNA